MIYDGMYKVFSDKVIYQPVAGPTIKEAINNAIEIAKKEKKCVELIANDVTLYINAGSDPIKQINKYLLKLDQKYRHEQMKLQLKAAENQK